MEYDIFVVKKQINKAKAQNLAHSDIDNAHGGILGAGSFSIVLKCLHKKSGDIRAVKYVEKKRMIGLRNKKVADKLIKEVHRGIELLAKSKRGKKWLHCSEWLWFPGPRGRCIEM